MASRVFRYWMLVVGAGIVLAGLLLAFAAPWFPAVQDLFYRSFSSGSVASFSQADKDHLDWIYGVLGGTLAGWGTLVFSLSVFLLKHDTKSLWNGMLVSVLVWFVVDTFLSWKFQVIPNLVVNVLILVLCVIPYVGQRWGQKES